MYIFDLDGTITDTNGIWQDVDLEFLARRGLTHTQEYQRVVERSIYPIAARFTKDYYRLPESPEEIMAEWDALADRHYRELAPLKPGAEDFLRRCAAQKIPLAVFTACRPALCRAALERCLANKTAALRYRRRDGTVQTVRFRRLPQGRVKIWGLS